MAGAVCLLNVLIYITWARIIDSAPLINIQPCLTDTNEVYFKDFDFQKFAGLWYTTWRSRSHVKEEHLQTESRHFYMKEDGTLSVVHTKKTGSSDCSMYEQTLTPFGNASYIQDSGVRLMLTIIETDYHSASLLMYCTQNFEDGVCADSDQYFEIISRDINIVPEIEMALLSKVDELCASFKDMVYLAAECQNNSIVVDTIPVLPRFNLQTKEGLSFALAQSNFTTPNSLIGFNLYLPNINRMIGWFTLEISDGSCSPVMSSMIKQRGKSAAHVYNRLGGLASRFTWYQWKVLYSDANYTLAYFCYSDYNGTCPRGNEEVRLDGRINYVDPTFQKKLYILLQKVCISPDNMRDLTYKVDCSSVLMNSISLITEEFNKVKNNQCTLENLVTSQYNRTVNQIDGIWYNIAAINSKPGNVLYITSNQENELEIVSCEPIDKTCEWNSQMRLVQLCANNAEFLKHVFGANQTATTIDIIRMVFLNDMTFFSYECRSESEGICDDGHLVFNVYSRVPNLSQKVYEDLEDFIPFFCLNISDLQTTIDFPTEDNYTVNKTDLPRLSECAVVNIPHTKDFNQTEVLGYWYEIARSGLEENTFKSLESSPHSAVVYFALNDLGHITFNYFAALEDKCVFNIFSGRTRPLCEEQFDGNFIARLHGKSWAFFKFLYMDHDNLIIMYACTYTYPDGQCAFPLLHVLGKKPTYSEELKSIMVKVLEKSCVNTVEWAIADYKKNCTDFFISKHEHPYDESSDHDSVQKEIYQLTTLQPVNENDTEPSLSSENYTDVFISEQNHDGHPYEKSLGHDGVHQKEDYQLTTEQPDNGNDTQTSLSSENYTDVFISEQNHDGQPFEQTLDHDSVHQIEDYQLTTVQPDKGNDTKTSLSSDNYTDVFIKEQHQGGHSYEQTSDYDRILKDDIQLTAIQQDNGNDTQTSVSSDAAPGQNK